MQGVDLEGNGQRSAGLRPWLLVEVGGCVLALGLVGSVSSLASAMPAPSDQAKPAQAQRDLDAARVRWRNNAIPDYRLRVTTRNPLLETVTESDVRNGLVVVARQSRGMPGVDDRPGSGNWGPSDGQTVETLFQLIDGAMQRPDEVVSATYDARRGFPTHIYTGPSSPMMDADVWWTIELIESPAAPLVPPSPGEAYRSPVPARLVDPGAVYSSLFGFGSDETERVVRRVWPGRADEITSRGAAPYWDSVGWKPQAGLVGDIIGTLTLPSGAPIYVLEFRHDGRTLFALVEKAAVQVIK